MIIENSLNDVDETFFSDHCVPSRYLFLSSPRYHSSCGGVLLIIKQSLKFTVLSSSCSIDFEKVACSVYTVNFHSIVPTCYRPPAGFLDFSFDGVEFPFIFF